METIKYTWTDYTAIAKDPMGYRWDQTGITEKHTTQYEVNYRDVFTSKALHMPALLYTHTAKELNPWTVATMGPKQWQNYLVRELAKGNK